MQHILFSQGLVGVRDVSEGKLRGRDLSVRTEGQGDQRMVDARRKRDLPDLNA